MKKESGITLVALVVTIVVLLILSGITITYIMGDNSIFKQAQEAKLKTEIAKAREKLEVTFGHAKLVKHTEQKYNQDDYLDDLMKKEIPNMKILDDIVIVDGYAFKIDRSEPKIGEYVGEEKDLIFPELKVTATLAADTKTATIHIVAQEDKNGISKIEIIQSGDVLEIYECENSKEEIIKDYVVKQNGIYTIKVYAKLTVTEKIKVEGMISSVGYSPNGNEEHKKEHQVKVSVIENPEKVKNIKYQWLETTVEPAEDTFTETCSNNTTIIGKGYTGTYYLWTLLETDSGKTNISRSEGFNFDNEGPAAELKPVAVSENSFTLNTTISDELSGIVKYEIYVDDKIQDTQTYTEPISIITVEKTIAELSMGKYDCKVIAYDSANNRSETIKSGQTKMYSWSKKDIEKVAMWTPTRKNVAKEYY